MGRNIANDPLQKYRFTVEIPGLPSLGFNKAGGLKRELAVVEYTEGGWEHTHKLIGREKVDPVTLERGMYITEELEGLYMEAFNNPEARNTITVNLNDRYGNPKRIWRLGEAWCSVWESTDFDSSSDDVAVEKITIEFEYFL